MMENFYFYDCKVLLKFKGKVLQLYCSHLPMLICMVVTDSTIVIAGYPEDAAMEDFEPTM